MNIYINHLPRKYSSGTIIVAANSEEQADKLYYQWLVKNNELELWPDDYIRQMTFEEFYSSEDRTESRYYYQHNTWKQLSNTVYNGDTPIVLDEENYIE